MFFEFDIVEKVFSLLLLLFIYHDDDDDDDIIMPVYIF